MTRDLMFQDEILAAVRRAYSAIPAGAGRAMAERFYSDEEFATLPSEAVEWSLGVHNPVRHAGLRPGDEVLDIGCGGGIDTVLAAQAVRPTGRVVGLDLLPEMCERARVAAEAAGVGAWCEFRVGQMEAIPLGNASIDVVISNGVINLSPRKSRALAEIARVLRPGGRLCVSDLTVEDDLPSEILTSESAWAGCISGALSEEVFTKKLANAGFVDVDMSDRVSFGIDDVALYPLFTPETLERMRELLPPDRHDDVCVGVIVRGGQAGRLMSAGDAVTPSVWRRPISASPRRCVAEPWSLWRTGTGPSGPVISTGTCAPRSPMSAMPSAGTPRTSPSRAGIVCASTSGCTTMRRTQRCSTSSTRRRPPWHRWHGRLRRTRAPTTRPAWPT